VRGMPLQESELCLLLLTHGKGVEQHVVWESLRGRLGVSKAWGSWLSDQGNAASSGGRPCAGQLAVKILLQGNKGLPCSWLCLLRLPD
jgi:hypothetical protein